MLMMRGWQWILWLWAASMMCIGCVTTGIHAVKNPSVPALMPEGKTISLAGKWKFHPATLAPGNLFLPTLDDHDWPEMSVPANWFLQSHDFSGTIWFRYHFSVAAQLRDKFVTLNFAGVDYAADVWLNGEYLGFHEGYFEPFRFVVSPHFRFDAENVLVVRVDSPREEVGRAWSFNKRLIKGIFNHHDTRPGGAWSPRGQEQNTGGIWAPVYLRVSQTLSIDSIQVTPVLHGKNEQAEAQVELSITYDGHNTREFSLAFALSPHNFTPDFDTGGQRQETFRLVPGKNKLVVTIPCANPYLWWTWDHGYPYLYALEVRVSDTKTLLDTESTVFGFRRIAYDQTTKQWSLNGHRIFLRGTNYIASQWLSEMTAEKYAADLTLMQQAHINAIRVHAHIEARDFYRRCDEVGMLVWQDFPLQWGYTDEPSFVDEAVRQARAMVTSLFNHPAIFTWCLHNEPPWDASWMQYKYLEYHPNHNKRLDSILLSSLQGVDPTRYVYPYSSTREHPWFGWYSGSWLDYGKRTQEPLITEYGAQALPDLQSLTKIFGTEELWPESKEHWENWEYHNFQRHETFDIAKVPQGKNIHEWIANSQGYQAKLIQFAAEAYRRQKFNPVTGIFQFMLVENWPSLNWGILDYWRTPKAGYFALQTAYQPVLPSITYAKPHWSANEPVNLELWVVNDSWQPYPGSILRYVLWNEAMVLEQESVTVHIDADSSEKILTIHKARLPSQHYSLSVTLTSAAGEILGWNQHDFSIGVKTR